MIAETHKRALLRELAQSPEGAWVTCAGRSMEPTIHLGDRVRVRACPLAALRVGDVVLFETEDGYVLHRIVLYWPGSPWFFHLGDAPTPAGPRRARSERIVGRAELPRRWPSAKDYAQLVRVLARGVRRRLSR